MSDTPIVSIVVPAYNGERHIRQCVESVLAVSYTHLDVYKRQFQNHVLS